VVGTGHLYLPDVLGAVAVAADAVDVRRNRNAAAVVRITARRGFSECRRNRRCRRNRQLLLHIEPLAVRGFEPAWCRLRKCHARRSEGNIIPAGFRQRCDHTGSPMSAKNFPSSTHPASCSAGASIGAAATIPATTPSPAAAPSSSTAQPANNNSATVAAPAATTNRLPPAPATGLRRADLGVMNMT